MVTITENDELEAIVKLFEIMSQNSEHIGKEFKKQLDSKVLDREEMESIEVANPKWGLETTINDKKFQLVLELKEVEND